ncbi:MAG: GDP-mannose 4,6-dehydratase [Solirubrobacteraceae bacterium]
MRALVTGGTGFAGRHLASHCADEGDEVLTLARGGDVRADLLDADATRRAVAEADPEAVYHLAAQAHVGRSWQDPAGTLLGNVAMAANLLEAVRQEAPAATVVAISSGEVYGPPATLPVDERAPLRPQSPYAVSKAATDLLAGFYADAHGLRVTRARAFNHAGPGQEPTYAIASFARQIALGAAVVVTGNPDARRDYTDVRDVVRAYRLLAAHGVPGEAYNVCSGHSASAAELVRALAEQAGAAVEHRVDPGLVRAHEVMEVRGAADRLREATGWAPRIPLADTLRDTVRWWREQAAPAPGLEPGTA